MDHRKTKAHLPRDLSALNNYISLVGIGAYRVEIESQKGGYRVHGKGIFGDAAEWTFNYFTQNEIDDLTFADWIDLFRVLSKKDF